MTNIDQQFRVRPLIVNIQRDMFTCNCRSVPFVRWTRVTHVRLMEKDQLTCSYGDRDNVQMSEIVVDQLEGHLSILPIVVPITVGVIIISIVVLFVRYHPWYIKYHLVLCWLRDGRTSSNTQGKQHDAMVTYFLYVSNSRDQQVGVARISRWVCTRLLTSVACVSMLAIATTSAEPPKCTTSCTASREATSWSYVWLESSSTIATA